MVTLVGVGLWPAPVSRSTTQLASLIAPLTFGAEIIPGYVLGLPHRGEAHDIVVQARRSVSGRAEVVELHVLDRGRWSGVRESASYGIAYEVPKTTASPSDAARVTEAFARAIRSHDRGGGTPVDELALPQTGQGSAFVSRLVIAAERHAIITGTALVAATLALGSLPHGAALVSCFLLALGLALRLPNLNLPFALDQDVQRVFTSHMSWREILTGAGLRDRHPPAYFLVLHVAQWFGQSEAVVRMPAVIAGSLAGPALVASARALRLRADFAALAGLVLTMSVELVVRSREVSSIPLFALILIVMLSATLRHDAAPSRSTFALVVVTHAAALFTYYTAIFPILASATALVSFGRRPRKSLRAVGVGVALGSFALVLAIATFARDRGARLAASAHPGLAWGERTSVDLARWMAATTLDAFGWGWLLVVLASVVIGVRRRDVARVAPAFAFIASYLGIACLAPVARVQPYYVTTVLPLLAMCVSASAAAVKQAPRGWAMGCVALGTLASVASNIAQLERAYRPPTGAFVAALAPTIAARSERRIAVLMHYDATLLAYYLGREAGVEVDWSSLVADGEWFALAGTDARLLPLVSAHEDPNAPSPRATARLEQAAAMGPFLVLARDSVQLPAVSGWLERCEPLQQAEGGRLLACAKSAPAGTHAP